MARFRKCFSLKQHSTILRIKARKAPFAARLEPIEPEHGGVLIQFHRLHLLTTFVEGTSKIASRAWVALEIGTASGDSGNNIDLCRIRPP
jgi:hypothetical protein